MVQAPQPESRVGKAAIHAATMAEDDAPIRAAPNAHDAPRPMLGRVLGWIDTELGLPPVSDATDAPRFPWAAVFPLISVVVAVVALGVTVFGVASQAGWYSPQAAAAPDARPCPPDMIADRLGRCRPRGEPKPSAK